MSDCSAVSPHHCSAAWSGEARSLRRASLHFADAQEQAAALSGWNQDYVQLSAGAFQGELAQVQGVGIKLFVERVQQSVRQTGVLPSGVLALGVPLNASGSGMYCGQACGLQSLHVFSGSAGFDFRTSRHHTMLGLELQLDATLALQPAALASAALADIKPYLMALYQSARCDPQLLHRPAVVASVGDYLLDRLQRAPETPPTSSAHAHWALVQRAVSQVQAAHEQAPTVTQLCLRLGVSRRTLQNAFQRVLNMGPLAYVKAVRLKQAREALKNAQSVTDAATACGFWHFGHFAHDYQAQFGERPSDTLRRHS